MKNPSRSLRLRCALALLCNLLAATFVAYCVVSLLLSGSAKEDALTVRGFICFRYFTVDSNILAALSCLLLSGYQIAFLLGKIDIIPTFVYIFKFIGCCAVAVTLLTVVFFLGFVYGYAVLFSGVSFYLHLVCPLLCAVSFVFLEGGRIPRRLAVLGALPVFLYGAVYLPAVLVFSAWPDFYHFNAGGRWYISLPVMYAAAVAIAFGARALHARFAPSRPLSYDRSDLPPCS